VVEWLNETGGNDSSPDWDYLNPELVDDGYAYVGVSAQALGVNGGAGIINTHGLGNTSGLKATEPSRYASLVHPGDQYSFDIFAQIGRALRSDQGRAVFANLDPKRVIADGESQSAFFLTTFVDTLQPLTDAYDGFLLHSRGGTGASLTGSSITSGQGPSGLLVRDDLNVPVFMYRDRCPVAGIWDGTTAEHQMDPDLGGSRYGAQRRLRTGPLRQVAGVYDTHKQRPSTSRRRGRAERTHRVDDHGGCATGCVGTATGQLESHRYCPRPVRQRYRRGPDSLR
jgi:Alpha/beta hydrolase domain